MRIRSGKFVSLLFAALTLLILSQLSFASFAGIAGESATGVVSQVLSLIERYYYEGSSVNVRKLQNAAIETILADLESRFTFYFSPAESRELGIRTSSRYGGIGIESTYEATRGVIEVVSPLYGTPAEKAGIESGDLITSIDGTDIGALFKRLGYFRTMNLISGTPGSTVTLGIYRPSDGSSVTLSIKRAVIKLKTVESAAFETSGKRLGYIRITNFSNTTPERFETALKTLLNRHVKGLILDLRDDPGGIVRSAVDVAGQLIPAGKLVTVLKYKDGLEYPFTSEGGTEPKIPIAVLVNHGTASSAEILASALRDNRIGVLVGERTFGKGVTQTEFRLSNGGALLLVTNRYFTPNGENINMKGIEPDYAVSSGSAAENPSGISGGVLVSSGSSAKLDFSDPQFLKAIQILITEIDAGVLFPETMK